MDQSLRQIVRILVGIVFRAIYWVLWGVLVKVVLRWVLEPLDKKPRGREGHLPFLHPCAHPTHPSSFTGRVRERGTGVG